MVNLDDIPLLINARESVLSCENQYSRSHFDCKSITFYSWNAKLMHMHIYIFNWNSKHSCEELVDCKFTYTKDSYLICVLVSFPTLSYVEFANLTLLSVAFFHSWKKFEKNASSINVRKFLFGKTNSICKIFLLRKITDYTCAEGLFWNYCITLKN